VIVLVLESRDERGEGLGDAGEIDDLG